MECEGALNLLATPEFAMVTNSVIVTGVSVV